MKQKLQKNCASVRCSKPSPLSLCAIEKILSAWIKHVAPVGWRASGWKILIKRGFSFSEVLL
ncbi:hypothetical protein LQV63_05455 [Paenibacillus profundus]|uniref:Uncharacterized protein n=1 Tax=Paenibacillus profundus TaxID=1173085 RepID=A0ABS8YE93_9BACL|nr:hypothetical protein [Paenibacillus profundus]